MIVGKIGGGNVEGGRDRFEGIEMRISRRSDEGGTGYPSATRIISDSFRAGWGNLGG